MSQQLQNGQPIPNFSVKDIHGNTISSSDYKGKKLLISFYRYAECMFCNLRINQLLQRNAEFEAAGLHQIAFFQSSKVDTLANVGKQQPPFPIIPDANRQVYKKYGVQEHSTTGLFKGALRLGKALEAFKAGYFIKPGKGSFTLIPADFLVNEDQTIHTAFYGSDITDHIPMEAIEHFLSI